MSNHSIELIPCMIDNRGRKQQQWLPHMQSEAFLRQEIRKGNRTAECWAEIQACNERVRAARAVIALIKSIKAGEV